jgi:hypothetical protein
MDQLTTPSPAEIIPSMAQDDTLAPPAHARRDGWTPFARRLFLEVLAETGRVSRACDLARLSPQSAYALRHRDPLFAAGWDAACAMARAPLADALYEQAIDGVTETLSRDGEIVAERHRHDSRLSIAVLHRLDKRCDLAAERGARHQPLLARWSEWIDLVGKGDDVAALALLDDAPSPAAPHHQLHQLPLGGNPTVDGDEEEDDPLHFWESRDGEWRTDFPPPLEFDGHEEGVWGRHGYSRQCTEAETDLLERLHCLDNKDAQAEAERERDLWLADMAAELEERAVLPPAPPSA